MDGVIRVHHAALTVSDIERSVDFYRALGFDLERRITFGGSAAEAVTGVREARLVMAFLILDSFRLELIEYSPVGRKDQRQNNDLGSTHICLEVRDIQAVYERLTAMGVRFTCPPHHDPSGVSMTYFRDPDGISVELLEVTGTDDP